MNLNEGDKIASIAKVARDCRVEPARLTFIYAPTQSLVGATQIAARALEVALHKVHELKFPLDRVAEMYHLTKDIRLVRHLCNQAGGFFVANAVTDSRKPLEENIFAETRGMVREFSELLDAVTESVEDAPGIDPDEADQIRQRWEDLKACVEKFVVGCEKGHYQLRRK